MTLSEKILAGIAVGLIVWFVQIIVSYFVQKKRLESAMIVDINYHLLGVGEAKNFLNSLAEKIVIEGKEITYCAHYTRDEYELYKSLQPILYKYFDKNSIEKTTKFYKAFWELEVLLEGMMKDLWNWKDNKTILNKDDIEYFKAKKARIESLAQLLTRERITKIADLPNDYRDRKGPEYIIK
jgi:hypothetical protein